MTRVCELKFLLWPDCWKKALKVDLDYNHAGRIVSAYIKLYIERSIKWHKIEEKAGKAERGEQRGLRSWLNKRPVPPEAQRRTYLKGRGALDRNDPQRTPVRRAASRRRLSRVPF